MKVFNIDFDRGNVRPFSDPKIAHGFEATINYDEVNEGTQIVINALDFIQYLIDTNVMLHGSFVNGYRDGLVVEVVNMETTYNYHRGEFDEYSGTRSCTIQEFINDYPINEMEAELIKYLEVCN